MVGGGGFFGGELGGAGADAGVGLLHVVEEEFAGVVVGGGDAGKKRGLVQGWWMGMGVGGVILPLEEHAHGVVVWQLSAVLE